MHNSTHPLLQAFVLPMVQGTSENAAWRIAKNGFGTVAITDDGYYGRGIYFTSSLEYASHYAQDTPEGKTFLISAVLPGNSFPVSEHPFTLSEEGSVSKQKNPKGYLGQACRAGYQSHYTIVSAKNVNSAFPIRGELENKKTADELVVFEASHALPLFLVHTKGFLLPSSHFIKPMKLK